MASTSSSTASANGPPCKKQKSGGTFCSAYGCSNRSLHDKQSKHDRNFISYHQFPKDNYEPFQMKPKASQAATEFLRDTDNENGETDDDLPSWCGCGNCTPCPVQEEALCCNDREDTFSMLRSKGDCIIDEAFFRNQLLCEEALTFSRYTMSAMFRTDAERQRYYKKDFTNNLKRHLKISLSKLAVLYQ